MLRPSLAFVFSSLLLACSGSSFEVAEDGTDAASEETGCTKNACGGCGTLANAPGVACGSCSTLKYKCSDDKTQTICPGDDKNECGGCGTLANPVGKSCGTCNTKSYVCTADKTNTMCSGDDANACGGCGTIASDKLPGSTCGVCRTLVYVCLSDKTATTCPSGGEDRTAGVDAIYTTYSNQIYTVPTVGYPIAIGFNTQHFGSITSVTLALLRSETGSGSTFLGSFQAVLVRGTSPDSTDELASFTITQEAISTIGGAPVTIALPTPTANVAAGTRLFLKLRETSDRYNFSVFGGSPGGPTDFGLFYRTSSGTWDKLTSVSPYLTVGVNGCF